MSSPQEEEGEEFGGGSDEHNTTGEEEIPEDLALEELEAENDEIEQGEAEEEDAVEEDETKRAPSSSHSPRKAGGKRVCLFWLKGRCKKGRVCPFVHTYVKASQSWKKRCFFLYKHGCCKKKNCEFFHGNPDRKLERKESRQYLIVHPVTLADLMIPQLAAVMYRATSWRVVYPGGTQHQKGFLLMHYVDALEAFQKAKRELKEVVLQDSSNPRVWTSTEANFTVKVEEALETVKKIGLDDGEPGSVFVSNIPTNCQQHILKTLFPSARSIEMPRVADGANMGYAILQFPNITEARNIVSRNSVHVTTIGENSLSLYVVGELKTEQKKLPDDKSEKKGLSPKASTHVKAESSVSKKRKVETLETKKDSKKAKVTKPVNKDSEDKVAKVKSLTGTPTKASSPAKPTVTIKIRPNSGTRRPLLSRPFLSSQRGATFGRVSRFQRGGRFQSKLSKFAARGFKSSLAKVAFHGRPARRSRGSRPFRSRGAFGRLSHEDVDAMDNEQLFDERNDFPAGDSLLGDRLGYPEWNQQSQMEPEDPLYPVDMDSEDYVNPLDLGARDYAFPRSKTILELEEKDLQYGRERPADTFVERSLHDFEPRLSRDEDLLHPRSRDPLDNRSRDPFDPRSDRSRSRDPFDPRSDRSRSRDPFDPRSDRSRSRDPLDSSPRQARQSFRAGERSSLDRERFGPGSRNLLGAESDRSRSRGLMDSGPRHSDNTEERRARDREFLLPEARQPFDRSISREPMDAALRPARRSRDDQWYDPFDTRSRQSRDAFNTESPRSRADSVHLHSRDNTVSPRSRSEGIHSQSRDPFNTVSPRSRGDSVHPQSRDPFNTVSPRSRSDAMHTQSRASFRDPFDTQSRDNDSFDKRSRDNDPLYPSRDRFNSAQSRSRRFSDSRAERWRDDEDSLHPRLRDSLLGDRPNSPAKSRNRYETEMQDYMEEPEYVRQRNPSHTRQQRPRQDEILNPRRPETRDTGRLFPRESAHTEYLEEEPLDQLDYGQHDYDMDTSDRDFIREEKDYQDFEPVEIRAREENLSPRRNELRPPRGRYTRMVVIMSQHGTVPFVELRNFIDMELERRNICRAADKPTQYMAKSPEGHIVVKFADQFIAEAALEELNGVMCHGKRLELKPQAEVYGSLTSPGVRIPGNAKDCDRHLYIRGEFETSAINYVHLKHYLNAEMERRNLCDPGDSPVQRISAYNYQVFARFSSAESANAAFRGLPEFTFHGYAMYFEWTTTQLPNISTASRGSFARGKRGTAPTRSRTPRGTGFARRRGGFAGRRMKRGM